MTLIPVNCVENWVEDIARMLNCGISKLPVNYLGIPLGANPKNIQTWKPIIEKVERRLALWKARKLSKAGRIVLIKATLNNLPMYYMSLFRLPKMVGKRIIQLQKRFLWGRSEGGKGGCPFSWEVIKKPKDQGGLGIRDIFVKNAALLFKWRLRFTENNGALWKNIIKSIHGFKSSGELHVSEVKGQDSIWNKVTNFESFSEETKEVARKGLQTKVVMELRRRFGKICGSGIRVSKGCSRDSFSCQLKRMVALKTWVLGMRMNGYGHPGGDENSWRGKRNWSGISF